MQPMFLPALSDDSYLLANVQTFSTPGTYTYTPTSGMVYCFIQCQAPGGGGGGGNSGGGDNLSGGAGGGGGYAQLVASAAVIGTSQSITIGTPGTGGRPQLNGANGGTTSVGVLLSCTGGAGGNGATNSEDGFSGIGGQASGGNLNISGQNGNGSNIDQYIRTGGNSYLGFGAQRDNLFSPSSISSKGGSYGGGGMGGHTITATGGNGGPGVVVITEYIAI